MEMNARSNGVHAAKEAARDRMWALLEEARVSPPPGPRGGIPNFIGAEEAARRLTELPEWRRASVIKVNPDNAQLPVRLRALAEGKLVYMAVPKLARDYPFVLLDPQVLSVPPEVAARKNDALREGRPARIEDMRPVDLVVAGSLAVSRSGARLGKGAGYTDIELGLLMDAQRISAGTPVATTVHDLQVVEEALPRCRFDFEVSASQSRDHMGRPRPGQDRGDPHSCASIALEVWGPVDYAEWIVGARQAGPGGHAQGTPRGRGPRRRTDERQALGELGLMPGVDVCAHALELSARGQVVGREHLSRCAVCLRRWRLTEAELQPWTPMDHDEAAGIMTEMAAVFGFNERGERYRPFYAHVARCPACERHLARLTFNQAVPSFERAILRS
jgi:5-formyltetrahydrofolate cyclo-ligase